MSSESLDDFQTPPPPQRQRKPQQTTLGAFFPRNAPLRHQAPQQPSQTHTRGTGQANIIVVRNIELFGAKTFLTNDAWFSRPTQIFLPRRYPTMIRLRTTQTLLATLSTLHSRRRLLTHLERPHLQLQQRSALTLLLCFR